jgi:pyruvate ferredoxin oxidoreductase beta subunit
MAPCTRGWRFDSEKTIRMSRLAVETRFFPLYEVEGGVYKITFPVTSPKPIEEYLRLQGRYAHMFRPENAAALETIKSEVDQKYRRIEKLSQLTPQIFAPEAK